MKKILLLLLSSVLFFISCSNNNTNNIFESINGNEYCLKTNTKITIGFENINVYGSAGLNRYFTSFSISNNQIIIGTNIGTTLMLGSDEDMKNEEEFLNNLSKANSISLNNDELIIKTSENKELVFKQRTIIYSDLYQREFILKNKYPEIGITLAFDTNRVYGFSGVNRYFGGYTLTNENNIIIGALGSTMMAGSEENMKAERDYTSILSEASNISLSTVSLEITSKSGEKLIFNDNSINDNKLLGKNFKLHNLYEYPNTEITISFYGTNNQVNGFAGVNYYRTSYNITNDNEVKFNMFAMTKMSGAKEDMEAESKFLKYMENAEYMYLKGKELFIIANDSSILRFIESYFEAKALEEKQ